MDRRVVEDLLEKGLGWVSAITMPLLMLVLMLVYLLSLYDLVLLYDILPLDLLVRSL
jgi:hypothetical protein